MAASSVLGNENKLVKSTFSSNEHRIVQLKFIDLIENTSEEMICMEVLADWLQFVKGNFAEGVALFLLVRVDVALRELTDVIKSK